MKLLGSIASMLMAACLKMSKRKNTKGGSSIPESMSLTARITRRLNESDGEPGVYYIVKFPVRWQLISHVWSSMGDKWHRHIWDDYLAKEVADAWERPAGVIKPLWKAFPRGRVERVGPGEYTIYHGDDLQPFMNVTRERIISAFELKNQKAVWTFDTHEKCDSDQKANLRAALGIVEDW